MDQGCSGYLTLTAMMTCLKREEGKYCNQGYSDSDDDLSCHDKYIIKLSDVRRMSEIDAVSGAAKMKGVVMLCLQRTV